MFQQSLSLSLSIITKPVLDSLSLSLASSLHAACIMVVFILWLLQAVDVFCSSRFSYSVVKSNTYCYTPKVQIWRTTRSAPGTSQMKARLVRLWTFCFTNAFPGKSYFVVDLVPFFRLPYAFLCSWMPLQQSGIFHSRESVIFSVFSFASEGKPKRQRQGVYGRRRNCWSPAGLESILENV